MARFTRFCTKTWAMFMFTPCWKVTASEYAPSFVQLDCMYSIFSTPFTCCSMGAATVSATTWALAPG